MRCNSIKTAFKTASKPLRPPLSISTDPENCGGACSGLARELPVTPVPAFADSHFGEKGLTDAESDEAAGADRPGSIIPVELGAPAA